ncbi:outer membrane beta-barrel protein [Flavobacterium sp. KACC 22761]|uniref:outer membrane beta-barrel protein n=1 Tax=Flavobacterium sp. KACC 22761 TaxID=3092665 RepID=UPI002A75E444|nr:outer membrane beta-barrel protein [Flavobacterium sp. KACC 22761]WPO78268.1 outer membrane beta-barrel protein [Flavobacterium sp. KACC 22761]
MKIKIAIAIFLLCSSMQAQEINMKLSGGSSGILYESSEGNGNLKAGGGIGIGYTYFLNNHWGINTGIDVLYNQNTFKLNEVTTINSYEVDDQMTAFEYRVSPKNYQEKQYFVSFAIPILLQYRTEISSQSQWYLGFGGKVLFPRKQNIKASADELQLSGYYPDSDLVIDDLPSHGFGKVDNWEDKTAANLKTSFLVSLETGLTFKLKENLQLYTGVFADYGFSDLAKNTDNSNIVLYDPKGIENTQANGVSSNKTIVQNSNYFSAGLQIKLGFSFIKPKEIK